MVTNNVLRDKFAQALPFEEYLKLCQPHEWPRWRSFADGVRLTPAQIATARASVRRVNVLVISGTWCGDCVQQCPILARFAEAHPVLTPGEPTAAGFDVRFIERDANMDFAEHFKICGGHRVPAAIFMNEDFDFISLLGDRTLTRYRAVAAKSLGPSCPLPGAPLDADELAATIQDWADEFERVALLVRLSAKLRQRHGD